MLSDHIVAIYPPSEACFWTHHMQWRRCRQWQPILQRHHTYIPSSCRWWPTCKKIPGSLYDGAALIAPEYGNTCGIWRPPCCGHGWSGCRPRRNLLATEAYPQSILTDGQKYREWKAIPKVRPPSRGDSAPPPPGRGYRSTPEVARSAKVHRQVQWL